MNLSSSSFLHFNSVVFVTLFHVIIPIFFPLHVLLDNVPSTWDFVPDELLVVIGQKLGSCQDYIKVSAVCKSSQSVMSKMRQYEKPILPLPDSTLLSATTYESIVGSCSSAARKRSADSGGGMIGFSSCLILVRTVCHDLYTSQNFM